MTLDEPATLAFRGEWRHYQELALEAFERDRAAGRRSTHLVAPPGSGKTLLGIELARRVGLPALVLAPSSAIQAQWIAQAARFSDSAAAVASEHPGAPLCVLTYQALARLDDPGLALRRAAQERWATERAAVTAQTPGEVARDAEGWTGAAAQRRDRELARVTAAVKREIARGEHAQLGALLAPGSRERVDALLAAGTRAVVLDECHHLASLWGYVVRAVLEELGDVHVVGLTATPPDELSASEQELYEHLLGPVDFQVPTPAVVRDGHLAPYQELAWLTEPLAAELDWLAEHDVRFQELVTALMDEDPSVETSLAAWVVTRTRHRDAGGPDEGAVSWEDFQRRRPALARAGVRFLASAGLTPPPGAPRGEGYRQPPDLEDWLVLLEDWALRCLGPDPSPAAAGRYEAVAAALRDFGFQLTRQGLRRGASDVDRLLLRSAAKPIALVEVLACEMEARGEALRAVVLCDQELASARPDSELGGVLDREAGSAVAAVGAITQDLRTAPLRPLLVTGRGVRCTPSDADALLAALREASEEVGAASEAPPSPDALASSGAPASPGCAAPPFTEWRAEEDADGLVRLSAAGSGWQPRRWVALATYVLERGESGVIVGTRGLLGEGWDAPRVNCLVDLTSVAAGVSVRQMRGRTLRLDPQDPEKIASNWDVVCVAPALTRGAGDYRRFVRRHLHLYAPCEDGTIEAGPSHVHPRLGPFAPPPAERFDEINRTMRERAAGHHEARRRWRIGAPYRGVELHSVVIAPPERAAPGEAVDRPPSFPLSQRTPAVLAGAGAVLAMAGAALEPALLAGVAATPAGATWAALRLSALRRRLPVPAPLDRVARAVAEAGAEVGAWRPEAAASLAVEPRASGYLRCLLRAAEPEESERFAAALDEALRPPESPRYLVARLVAPPGRGPLRMVGRLLVRRAAFDAVWSAVPADFARSKDRAQAYARAWARWVSPTRLVFAQRSDEGRRARAEAAAQGEGYETQRREIWL